MTTIPACRPTSDPFVWECDDPECPRHGIARNDTRGDATLTGAALGTLRSEAAEMDRAIDLLDEHRDNDAIEWVLATWRLRVRRALPAAILPGEPEGEGAS